MYIAETILLDKESERLENKGLNF